MGILNQNISTKQTKHLLYKFHQLNNKNKIKFATQLVIIISNQMIKASNRISDLFHLFIVGYVCFGYARCKYSVPILSQQIGQSIFHQNKLYLIYVADYPDENRLQLFNQYCSQEGKLCTVLSPQVDRYRDFKTFIGETKPQYFAIVDVERRKKYVLPVVESMTAMDLSIFQSKFEQGLLNPFYSSQQPDPKPYQKCQKVVSKNLDNFLQSQTQIKVLFLYTQHKSCDVCGEMLRDFADLAEKLYDKQIVKFGYYDIFKNDHPRITDEILPYFLIFTKDKYQPYGLAGEKFHELEETIIQAVLKDTDIDLQKFRRQHAINKQKQKPLQQFQFDYKVPNQQNPQQKQNLEQL